MKNTLVGILLFSTLLAGSAAAETIAVTVTPQGTNRYQVTLQTVITAPTLSVWNVLTDYDHHSTLLPYMSKSRIAQKAGNDLTIEQEGRIRVLFWTFTMQITQQVKHQPPVQMDFHAIAGDFQQLDGTWRLTPQGDSTQIACNFVVQPKRKVPEWAVRFTARHYLTRMMHSLAEHAAGASHE